MSLGVRNWIVNNAQASNVIHDGAIKEVFDIVPCFISLVSVDPIDGCSNVWRFLLVLHRLRVARRGFNLTSPRFGIQELVCFLVTILDLSSLFFASWS